MDLGVLDAAAAIAASGLELPERARWLDVGSGNGLNAIPLALAFPGWEATWVERSSRKAEWLAGTAEALGLSPRIVARDAGELSGPEWRGFGVVTARALAPPAEAASLLAPFVGSPGLLLLFAGSGSAPDVDRLGPGRSFSYEVREDAPPRALLVWSRGLDPPP